MLLLLTDKSRCPRCGSTQVSKDTRRCLKCFAVLLWPGDTGVWLTDQGLRAYWIWNKDYGWVSSDHLVDGKVANPNDRDFVPVKPPEDYGTKPLPKGCSDKTPIG